MKIRKGLSVLLALAFILGLVSALPVTASAEGAPVIVLGSDKVAPGNTIYFGRIDDGAIAWRVLSDVNDARLPTSQTGEALLIPTTTCAVGYFYWNNSENRTNQWSDSEARKWCVEFLNNWAQGSAERNAIKKTTVSETDDYTSGSGVTFGPMPLDDFFFFLSAREAEAYFTDDNDRKAQGSCVNWWTRSPCKGSDSLLGKVQNNGQVNSHPYHGVGGYRPAFNLDLSAVAFVSAAEGGKTAPDGAVAKIGTGSNTAWKLTLKDPGRSFTASADSLSVTGGGRLSISYSGAKTGANEYISVLLCDVKEARYYGSVKAGSASGSAEFTLPADMIGGSYMLLVFNEQKNADKVSDLTSPFIELELQAEGGTFVEGNGEYAFTDGGAEFQKPAKDAASVKIPDLIKVGGSAYPVTRIADNAFKNQKKLTKVTIGKNIKEIGKNAFANCAKLKTVSGGANIEVIGDSAFVGCKALTKFTIGAKFAKIGKKVFNKCAALKKITIKTKLLTAQTVGSAAFKGINAGATIKVPKAVKKDYTKWLLKKGVKKTMKIK